MIKKIEKNEYAPVIIPTLFRKEHFERCIESLRKNKHARETKLYIGLDFPIREEHKNGHEAIKQYLAEGISGFGEIVIFEHQENLGADANRFFLQDKVFEKFDSYIFTEDDNEFSPNFLEFMNQCLKNYEEDESVLAITGFNYPIKQDAFSGNVYSNNIYFSAWGYGTWKKKILLAHQSINMKSFLELYRDNTFMRELKKLAPNQYCNFVKGMLEYTNDLVKNKQIREIDLAYGIYMFGNHKRMVFPVKSMVRNWGYDGTGDNCDTLMYDTEKKTTHRNFEMRELFLNRDSFCNDIDEEKKLTQLEISRIVDEYFEVSFREKRRTFMAYLCSQIFGLQICKKIISLKK